MASRKKRVNIGGNPDDPSYRYTMPPLEVKVEGRGNGIKTSIPNMVEVARCLKRDPAYCVKFFGHELGAVSSFSPTTSIALVNGSHTQADMQDILTKFIDRFVLCPGCGNPETLLNVVSKDELVRDCISCGHQGPVDPHKLVKFIYNHPPGGQAKGGRRGRKGRGRGSAGGGAGGGGEEAEEADPDVEAPPEVDAATLAAAQAELGGEDEDEDEEEEDDEETEWIKSIAPVFADTEKQPRDVAREAKSLQTEEMLDDQQLAMVVMEAVLWEVEPSLEAAQERLRRHTAVLQTVCETRHSQRRALRGLERVCCTRVPDLLPSFVHLVKFCYDEDIFEEEAIVKWFDQKGHSLKDPYLDKKKIKANRKVVAPLIEWLKTAESEEDDSDD